MCIRNTPIANLSCFNSLCTFNNSSEERMQTHIQKEHLQNRKLKCKVFLFTAQTGASSKGQQSTSHNQSGESSSFSNLKRAEVDNSTTFASASGEESTSEVTSAFGIGAGPIRQRMPRLPVRPTPYNRTNDASSQSASPTRRHSVEALPPLHIPSPHTHLSALSAAPSPLQQLVYLQPDPITTPPVSDNEMDVDEPESPQEEDGQFSEKDEPPFNEEEALAKGSFAIVPLPHLHTTPPTRLLVCTKCRHGILPSSLISHSKEHCIKLLPVEKKNLQRIMDNSSYLGDSIEVESPQPPCPPIEGIQIQDGFACDLCSYCCITVRTMQSHFSNNHKTAVGFAKANSKPAELQALFARRPKYFAVAPGLRGLNDDDLFTIYLKQCAPELDALRILNPPLSTNEIPPLLKVTQWHEHLKDYTTDRDSVRKLLGLLKLPTSKKGEICLGSPLRKTIEGYLRNVRVKAHNASLGIKCLLKECPRYAISLMLGFNVY
jgi:Orsellinic acid/F9775 biosynthesis cluster protein D